MKAVSMVEKEAARTAEKMVVKMESPTALSSVAN